MKPIKSSEMPAFFLLIVFLPVQASLLGLQM